MAKKKVYCGSVMSHPGQIEKMIQEGSLSYLLSEIAARCHILSGDDPATQRDWEYAKKRLDNLSAEVGRRSL